MNELKNRGVQDILIAAVDGLTGFPDAISTVFPKTEIQLCMVRNSLKYVPYKDRKAVTSDLKEIYLAASEDAAMTALDRFSDKWDKKYASISRSWRNRWNEVIPFMKFSPEIRRTKGSQRYYTTNAIESLNYTLQRNLKTRLSFPNNESAMKLIYRTFGSHDLAKDQEKVDNAVKKLGRGIKPVCAHLRGQSPLMKYSAFYTKNVKGSEQNIFRLFFPPQILMF